jgi:hypothetical protein
MAKLTPEQRFAAIFARFSRGSTPEERAAAEKAMDKWLKQRGKDRGDIPKLLAQAVADDVADEAAKAPPPPPSDPRDAQPHPFEDPKFTPVGLVHGIISKYLFMPEHIATVYSLWICFTHVYTQFRIAPRLAFVSKLPDSGKTTALDVGRCLVLRPNPEALSTGAATIEFLDEGPGTVCLDELDHADRDARRNQQLIWNLGHKRGAMRALVVRGRRKLVKLHAPMMAAGIGAFLGSTQMSRTYVLDMVRYTEETTKPEREFDEEDTGDLDAVYAFLRSWSGRVKLDKHPEMPRELIRRHGDNARGMLSIADSCGWGHRGREAIMKLFEQAQDERPFIKIIRHGLVIFDALGLDQISTVRFNRELKRLALPDADWTQYRGPSGLAYAHPIEHFEQAALLGEGGIHSVTCWPAGKRERGASFKGYKLAQFEEAHRKYRAPDDARRLRLIPTSTD